MTPNLGLADASGGAPIFGARNVFNPRSKASLRAFIVPPTSARGTLWLKRSADATLSRSGGACPALHDARPPLTTTLDPAATDADGPGVHGRQQQPVQLLALGALRRARHRADHLGYASLGRDRLRRADLDRPVRLR